MELIKRYFKIPNKTLQGLILSNIVKSVSQWLLLIILVKFFSDEDVGYYTYGLAIAAPIFMLSEMQLKSIYVVEPLKNGIGFPVYNFIRVISVIIAALGLFTYCKLTGKINWILILVIIYKSIESLIDIIYGYLQKIDKMVWMSNSDMVKSALTIILCILAIMTIRNIEMAITATIFASFIMYIIDLRYIQHKTSYPNERITIKQLIEVLKKGLPLGISVLFSSYITNYPRIVVENELGVDMLAYFGAYSYLAIGLFQIQIPIQTYLRQRLSNYYQAEDFIKFKSLLNKTVFYFIIFGIMSILIITIFRKFIINILYKPSYIEYSYVLVWLFLGQLLTCIAGFYSIAILSFNIYTKQIFITGLAFSIVFLTSKYIIQDFGLVGASIESIIAGAVSLFSYFVIYLKRSNI